MKIIKMKNGIRASVSEQQAAVFVALGLAVIEDEPVVKKPLPIPVRMEYHRQEEPEPRKKRKYHRRDMERED